MLDDGDGKGKEGEGESGNDRWLPLFVVTVVLLVAFGILIILLMDNADSANETTWNRHIYLFAAAEAIVFTSVGWLFGREVHRSEAKTAKDDAAAAKKDAKDAKDAEAAKVEEAAVERTKGQAVKAAVRHGASGRAADAGGGAQPVGLEPGAAAADPLAGVRGMVEELWPD